MRKFMDPKRLWGTPGGPDEDWLRPHVLWLPQHLPDVINYFDRVRAVASRHPDVIAPIATADLHMTVQKIDARTADGTRVSAADLERAAEAVREELAALDPFGVEIGPARASGSAGIVEIRPSDDLEHLYRSVRTGLIAAGLQLPDAERPWWAHMSAGYGVQDTDTPELAARSDRLASALGRAVQPPTRVTALVESVWLVWERQHPGSDGPRYSFERVHELHLARGGSGQRAGASTSTEHTEGLAHARHDR
ncbi:2'-5' RNA ligase family protein [Kitasatospora sp. NPDC088783]|uniref:2'-5' RNA ligase family protein n=1 Tax=Kitasatospora sp. NPDC088783 TaxID=3364077 RepID=UPI00380D9A99